MMKSKLCNVCNISIPETCVKSHEAGKKHMQMVRLSEKKAAVRRTVYVGPCFGRSFLGIPEVQFHIKFVECGTIKKIFLDKIQGCFAFIEFENEQSAQKALDLNGTEMLGYKLKVSPKRHENDTTRTKPGENEGNINSKSDTSDIIGSLQEQFSVSAQMDVLVHTIELSTEDHAKRRHICMLLEQVLQQFFPVCGLYPFGSSANGFGTKGCDLDLSLDLEIARKSAQFDPQVLSKDHLFRIRNFKVYHAATLQAGELAQMTQKKKINLIKKIIQQCLRTDFKNVLDIGAARVPVVKFYAPVQDINCDASINNRLGFANSDLLKLYSVYDLRVRPLALTIRHWAKVRGVSNQLGPGNELNNYAVTLLVLFYLQHVEVIPSVQQLRDLCEPREVCILDGWDCSFCKDVNKFPRFENTWSPEELLTGFFEFYADEFDFNNFVVCPLSGKLATTNDVINSLTTPEMTCQFKITSMCVQDPFVLDHNVAANVPAKTFLHIREELMRASELCKSNHFVTSPDRLWGLSVLFTSLEEKLTSEKQNIVTKKQMPDILLHQAPRGCYTFNIIFKKTQLSLEFLKKAGTPDRAKHLWFHAVVLLCHKILSECLLFECELEPQLQCDQCNVTEQEAPAGASGYAVVPMKNNDNVLQCNYAACESGHEEELQLSSIEEPKILQEAIKTTNVKRLCRTIDDNYAAKAQQLLDAIEEPNVKHHCRTIKDNHASGAKRLLDAIEAPNIKRHCGTEANDTATPKFTNQDKNWNAFNANNSSATSSDLVTLLYKYAVKHRTYVGRKKMRNSLDSTSVEALEIEKELSQLIISRSPSSRSSMSKFDLLFLQILAPNYAAVQLMFKPTFAEKEFKQVFSFLQNYVPRLIDKCFSLKSMVLC